MLLTGLNFFWTHLRELAPGRGGNLTAIKPAPWTNVYGLARSLLAAGTFLTLGVNSVEVLFLPLEPQVTGIAQGQGFAQFSLFAIVPGAWLPAVKLLSLIVLAAVMVGWRPRLTGLPHWWVSSSFAASAAIVDGGDHITAVLSLLLLPIALTDPRKWHWQHPEIATNALLHIVQNEIARSAHIVIRIQIAFVYLHAAVGKFTVQEWSDGTALYYWFTHPVFGAPEWLSPLVDPVITSRIGVTLLTWGALAIELALFTGLVMERKWRRWLLMVGLTFHAGIAIVHGLISFSLAMAGALILYLRPVEEEIRISNPVKLLGIRWHSRSRSHSAMQRVQGARSVRPERVAQHW